MPVKEANVDRFIEFVRLSMKPEMQRAINYIVFKYDSASFEDYAKAHPPGSQNFDDWMRVAAFYDFLGALVVRGHIDRDLVFDTFPIPWIKMRPVALGMREALRWPDMWTQFEALDRLEHESREAKEKAMLAAAVRAQKKPRR